MCDSLIYRDRYSKAGVERYFSWDGVRVVLRAAHDLDGQ